MKYLAEITKDERANDLHNTFNNPTEAIIWITQNSIADDGYRIIEYVNKNGGLREGSKAVVRSHGEEGDPSVTYDTLDAANSAIAELAASDGYELIDLEQPVGSAASILIGYRPSLWQRHHEVYYASRANNHSRTDSDRY